MLNEYKIHVQERADQNIPPLPLDADQTSQLVELLKSEHDESDMLLHLLKERVPAGVDQSAYVKAAFLADITTGEASSPYINKEEAVGILGTMLGGYNIQPLIECLKIEELGDAAADAVHGRDGGDGGDGGSRHGSRHGSTRGRDGSRDRV